MNPLNSDLRIILASNSPRRKELMTMARLPFEIMSGNIAETHPKNFDPKDIPVHLATLKAKAVLEKIEDNAIVIGADTIVLLQGKIFEKPQSREEAIAMLCQLSGQMHEVITGVCICSKQKEVIFSDVTRVYFNSITPAEAEYYVDEFRPFDKAGSYACQEWIGAIGINRFEGDYFNVVGLPINRVYRELKQF